MPLHRLIAALRREDDEIFGRLARSRSMLGDTVGRMVLDIGSGSGWLFRALDEHVQLFSLDRARTNRSAVPAGRFVQADARTLPFAESSFDVVTLFEVLEHVPAGSERRVLAEIARVLRPGGRLLMSSPSRSVIGMLLDPAWWVRGHRHYASSSIADFLEREGFSDLQIWTEGGLAEAIYIPCFYLFSRLRVRIPYETAWRAAIDAEYRGHGWYTLFATGRRADRRAPETGNRPT